MMRDNTEFNTEFDTESNNRQYGIQYGIRIIIIIAHSHVFTEQHPD